MATQSNETALVIDWLRVRQPDDWHRLALGWNWDHGLTPMQWIVTQTECDKATALHVFWLSAPDTVIECPDEATARKKHVGEEWPVLRDIVDRWSAGRYKRSEIAYDDGTQWDKADWKDLEKEVGLANLPFRVPDGMFSKIAGRVIHADPNVIDGLPPEVHNALKAE